MKRFLKTAILSAAVAATTLATLPAANAGEWRHGGGHWNNNYRHNNYYRYNNNGDALAAGVLGLAAGALIVGLASQPTYRDPVYVEPRPRPYRNYPEVVYAEPVAVEPWSPQWYQYCSDRYRSFNERTGTYTGYDGRSHFCVAN